MRLLKRGVVILAAFAVSGAVAIPLFLALLSIAEASQPTLDLQTLPYAAIGAVLVLALTFVPAMATIAYAEFRRIRHWLYFVAAGGLTALLLLGLLSVLPETSPASWNITVALGLVIAGFGSGLVYWAIAGRNSGAFRDAWVAPRATGTLS